MLIVSNPVDTFDVCGIETERAAGEPGARFGYGA